MFCEMEYAELLRGGVDFLVTLELCLCTEGGKIRMWLVPTIAFALACFTLCKTICLLAVTHNGDDEVVRSGAPTMMQETNLGLATGPGVVAKIGVESHGVCVPVLFVFWLPNHNHAIDGCVFP